MSGFGITANINVGGAGGQGIENQREPFDLRKRWGVTKDEPKTPMTMGRAKMFSSEYSGLRAKPIRIIGNRAASCLSPDIVPSSPVRVNRAIPINRKLKVGKNYMVRRNNDQWYGAEIIQVRTFEDEEEFTPDVFEYFVHFKNHDKRLDEWVSQDRIMTVKEFEDAKDPVKAGSSSSQQSLSQSSVDTPESTPRKMTRTQKRKLNEINNVQTSIDEMDPTTAALEKEHEENTKVKLIDKVQLGPYLIDTWYFGPYPDKYGKVRKLFICQYCLKYTDDLSTFKHHWDTCTARQPPGKEIYRKGTISVFEVDGKEEKLFCQNLCLICKLFLNHKMLYYDVSDFLFYVLCEVDQQGANIVGYFSKEKFSLAGNNVSCILVLPPHQKKGFGKLLIDLSYNLSRREKKAGTPETPLSDLGKRSYRSYWTWILLQILRSRTGTISVQELSDMTCFKKSDIISTLNTINMVKYWKGQQVICATAKTADEHIKANNLRQPRLMIDPRYLKWAPPPTVEKKEKPKRR